MENSRVPSKIRQGYFSLRSKLVLGFSLVATIASLVTAAGFYYYLRNQLIDGVKERVLSIAQMASLQQNGNEFLQITSGQDPLYEKFRIQNLKIRRSDPDIIYVYTMRRDTQGIYFIVDAVEPGEENSALFGERYDDPSATLVENFDTMEKAIVEPDIYTDKFGSFLSAYAPIYTDNGERAGVIGVDVLATTIAQKQRQILFQSVIIFLVTLGTAIFAGYLAGNALTRPVTELTESAHALSSGNLSQRVEINTRDEIGDLAQALNDMAAQLQDTLGGLERRVTERTADLNTARLLSERRAQELQAISEISRAISTEQRLEILLPLITRLVSERFDFYHVGIFIVDDTRQFAYLQAANSDGGQRMLARGHRLEIGKGLVGTAAQTAKPRIALDTGSDATFFNNPDLPGTRSEMALPLNIRARTIGVLDVQSTKPGAFTEGDANTLGVLADQVAIAIENARLFGQREQAREEAEALYAQIQRQEWSTFAQQETRIGYRHSASGGKRLVRLVENDEIREALRNGRVVVLDGRESRLQPAIAIPVKLRGQTIGVLNIKAPSKDRKWNQDEINLAQAISDRLALALDNARLLHESQRRAAKEARIGEVSSKIGASINMRNVLQTAVEELGRALPGSEVVIQFETVDGERAS